MFDIAVMKTFHQYITHAEPQRTHEEWATFFGFSRSHFTEILNGSARPGKRLIERINVATGGEVPPAAWFQPLEATEAQGAST